MIPYEVILIILEYLNDIDVNILNIVLSSYPRIFHIEDSGIANFYMENMKKSNYNTPPFGSQKGGVL